MTARLLGLVLFAIVCLSVTEQASAAREGCVPGSVHRLRSSKLSYAATGIGSVNVRRAGTTTRFSSRNANGVPMVFGVLAARVDSSCRPTFYRLQLPIRPTGATGWVRALDVQLRPIRTRIKVELSRREITLFLDGRPILVHNWGRELREKLAAGKH